MAHLGSPGLQTQENFISEAFFDDLGSCFPGPQTLRTFIYLRLPPLGPGTKIASKDLLPAVLVLVSTALKHEKNLFSGGHAWEPRLPTKAAPGNFVSCFPGLQH